MNQDLGVMSEKVWRIRGFLYGKNLESNAAGLVLRPALKTGFSEMGWGSTPLLSAKVL